jgi:hypothetical protein
MTVVTRTRHSIALYVRTFPMSDLKGRSDVPFIELRQSWANEVETAVVLVSRR